MKEQLKWEPYLWNYSHDIRILFPWILFSKQFKWLKHEVLCEHFNSFSCTQTNLETLLRRVLKTNIFFGCMKWRMRPIDRNRNCSCETWENLDSKFTKHHKIRETRVGNLKTGAKSQINSAVFCVIHNPNLFEGCAIAWNASEAIDINRFLSMNQNRRPHFLHFHWEWIPFILIDSLIDCIKFVTDSSQYFASAKNDNKWSFYFEGWNNQTLQIERSAWLHFFKEKYGMKNWKDWTL